MEYEVTAESTESDAYAKFVIRGENGNERQVLHVSGSGDSDSVDEENVDFTEFAGQDVTFRLVAKEEATIQVESLTVSYDSDGDGLWNNEERSGFQTVAFGTVKTDPYDDDTDGDGLSDSEELGGPVEDENGIRYKLNSHPEFEDFDGDTLTDPEELEGWTINITRDDSGEPWRHDPSGDANETMEVYSSPLKNDTDGDGAYDNLEVYKLGTDPNEMATYGVTEQHQQELIDETYEKWENADDISKAQITLSLRAIGVLGPDQSAESLETLELNDRTDDSDFVTPEDNVKTGIHAYTFTALDGTERTDTWYPNYAELGPTEIWDPDTDDDGLTDGQEALWITESTQKYGSPVVERTDILGPRETDPMDPDSDGDGYWDGWIGVHGASNSTNIILYREHLHDEDSARISGIVNSEAVPEQAGYHELSDSAPTWAGVDIDNDGEREHSNIHIGELQWDANPSEATDKPSPQLTVEVDYFGVEANETLNTESWETGIEQNYRFYGINVDIVRDQALTKNDFHQCVNIPATVNSPVCVEPDKGFGYREIMASGLLHGDFGSESIQSDEYVLVAPKAGGLIPNSENQSGVNLLGLPYQGVFLKGNKEDTGFVSNSELRKSPYNSKTAMVTAKTEIHEIGHSFNAGELDDQLDRSTISRAGEVYSGSNADDTKEPLDGRNRWSVMSSSYYYDLGNQPMKGRYFAFSLEEVLSMEEPKDD